MLYVSAVHSTVAAIHMRLLSTSNVTNKTERLYFQFYLFLINLRNHIWLVATISKNAALAEVSSPAGGPDLITCLHPKHVLHDCLENFNSLRATVLHKIPHTSNMLIKNNSCLLFLPSYFYHCLLLFLIIDRYCRCIALCLCDECFSEN